jgi:hypothetical protein
MPAVVLLFIGIALDAACHKQLPLPPRGKATFFALALFTPTPRRFTSNYKDSPTAVTVAKLTKSASFCAISAQAGRAFL